MDEQDKLKELQEHLAKDLVHLEENESLSEQQLDKITDTYSKVYDIITEIKSL
jgi:transcriptional regulatory protein LevR